MIDWQGYFPKRILDRGREYFSKGKVKGFVQTTDSCMARILGTQIYSTKIWGFRSGSLKFSCNCAYAKDGNLCKHEAALLFEWEKNKTGFPEEEVTPFIEKGDTYFVVRDLIEKYDIKTSDIKEAEKLLRQGKVRLKDVDLYYTSSYEGGALCISFTGEYLDSAYSRPVKISFTKEKIINANCSAFHQNRYAYYSYFSDYYNNLCSHEIALLFLADEYIKKYNPGDETDFNGDKILDKYKKISSIKTIDSNVEKKKILRLEPRLSYDGYRKNNKFDISFKIGADKVYVLKNINELVEAKNRYSSLKLGKNYAISFLTEEFDDVSQKYFQLIEDAKEKADIADQKLHEVDPYTRKQLILKDTINLDQSMIDEFYDIAKGQKVEFKDVYGVLENFNSGYIKIGDGKLHVSINIKEVFSESGAFIGLKISGNIPDTIKGKKYDYIIDEQKGVFARIDEIPEILKILVDNSSNGQISFTVGKKNLAEFYYRFLPELLECPQVDVIEENPDRIQRSLPPKGEITYYMDANSDEIIGKVSVKYGNEEIVLHPLRDQDFPLSDYRDSEYEQNAINALMKYLPDYMESEDAFICERTGDNVFNILSEGIKDIMFYGEVKASKDFENLRIRKTPKVKLGVSVESGILNLDISTDDMSEEELLGLLDSYKRHKKFYRLKNGEFVSLEHDETLEELTAAMDAMGITVKEFTEGKLHLPLYRAVYINRLLEEHDEIAAERDKNFKSLVRNFSQVKDSDIEVPSDLEKTLRGYQKYGYKWLHMITDLGFGGILADDMGLGKTLQMIALLLGRKNERSEDEEKLPSLVICPASLVYNWQEEFGRFAPSLKVDTVTGSMTERKNYLKNLSENIDKNKDIPDVLVTSYDLLKRDIALYEKIRIDIEVIDEAQYIKNASAAVSKSVKIINAAHRFALTGTPIENRLSELWSIFDFLMPGFLYTYDKFRDSLETPITKFKDEEATGRLKHMVGPFVLRRLKENVLKDLPDKIEEVRYARFEDSQRKLYDAQVTHMKKILQSQDYNSGKDKLKVLAELTKIRQICCDPELITTGFKGESAKRRAAMDLIESAIDGGHRMLVFSQFTSMLELLEKDLNKEGIDYYKITGQTSKEDRIKLVHAFNENEIPVFLISLKAGGTGLNLIGADVVIHYDPWWNLAAQNQATDRAHRIGQTKKVSVFKLIIKDTIEEKILKMQEAKKDLADAILSGEGESLSKLTKEELMDLLN